MRWVKVKWRGVRHTGTISTQLRIDSRIIHALLVRIDMGERPRFPDINALQVLYVTGVSTGAHVLWYRQHSTSHRMCSRRNCNLLGACFAKLQPMNIVTHGCPLLLMAATICATPALARSYLNCLAKKVIIVDSPRGSNLSSTEDKLGFWIDEAAQSIILADGTPLTVHRFDDRWISADRGDLHYEFDRQNGNLMYASSTTKEGVATTTIGSGHCETAAGPPR
jgi:hypothetical protein